MDADKRIPEMNRYDEIAEFWETHSLADYWEEMEAAEFEIDPNTRRLYLIALDPGLIRRVQRLARLGLSTESLVNLFLEQHLHQVESQAV